MRWSWRASREGGDRMCEEELQLIARMQETAAAEDTAGYRAAVLSLMEQYNRFPNEEMLSFLQELLYVPNAASMCENYERARTTLAGKAAQKAQVPAAAHVFPAYDALPFRLFPVDEDSSVIFLQTENRFLLYEGGTRFFDAVRAMILDAPMDERLSLMAAALREVRVFELREQLFRCLEQCSFPPQAKELAAEFAALSSDASEPLFIRAVLSFALGDLREARLLAERAYALRVVLFQR